MFNLIRYPNTAALASVTGLSLTPIAGAFNALRDDKPIQTIPSLRPAESSSELIGWLLSGYLGNFLEWTGKSLTDIGRDAFGSERERGSQSMRGHEEGLRQLLSKNILGDKEVEAEVIAALGAYLRNGRSLMKEGKLEPAEWKRKLIDLQSFSEMTGDENTAGILKQWIEQIEFLLEKKVSEERKEAAELNGPENGPKTLENYQRENSLSSYSSSSINSTIDLGALGKAGFTVNGTNGGGGQSVSGAGDVNGDGFSDIIVGAPYTSNSRGSGMSYVVFGSNSNGLPGSTINLATLSSTKAGFTMIGANFQAYAGYSVSDAGDVNKDGYADVIIGALGTTFSGFNVGASYVVFGSKSASLPGSVIDLGALSSTKAGFTIKGQSQNGRFGSSVSGAGDVNKDGYDDVIIGAPYATGDATESGMSYVVFGGTTANLAGSIIDVGAFSSTKAGFQIKGPDNNYSLSGKCVSGAGDVNGDGYADVIIGAYLAVGDPVIEGVTGASYVIFGNNSNGLAGTVIDLATLSSTKAGFKINGVNNADSSGWSVSGAGDVNKDGYADVLIGAYSAKGDATESGMSYVVFGSNSSGLAGSVVHLATLSSTKAGFTIKGSIGYGFLGASVSNAGDLNKDGYDDVIIGAPSANVKAGVSYVVFGGSSARLAGCTIDLATLSSNGAGLTINGENYYDYSGTSVSGAGDVNGDGYADVIIEAPGINVAAPGIWLGYVVFGGVIANGTSSSLNTASKVNNPYGFFSSPTLQATPEPLTEFNRSTRLRGGR